MAEGSVDINIIKQYFELMIQAEASDMFLTYNEPPCLRINRRIVRYHKISILDDSTLESITNTLLCFANTESFEENNNVDFGFRYESRSFRINLSKQQGHLLIVVRLLLQEIPALSSFYNNGEILKKLIQQPSGLIIVSGPTGAGKSTLLASMIEEINKNYSKHIISIEDPIEYVFISKKSVVEQKELGIDVMSFSDALKSVMRQNPDVILFGEMRSKDSIQQAITLAETGHLLITTTHAKTSGQTISKIIDSFPSGQQNQVRLQLADNLVSVINQRMLHTNNATDIAVAQEILINNTAITNSIRKNDIKNIKNIIMTSQKQGMQLLEKDLLRLVKEGKITPSDAILTANDPRYVKDYLDQ